jgi:amino-acid N-acetyltransferase
MIVPEIPETIRPAAKGDIPGILQILEPLEQQGILVRRTSEDLERDLPHFFVIEADGNILGSAAIYPFPEASTAELAALAVNPFYRDGGRGERLLAFAEAKAKAEGMKSIFVLSTRTTHWFIERGFVETDISKLPERRQSSYNPDRRSKVFIKEI